MNTLRLLIELNADYAIWNMPARHRAELIQRLEAVIKGLCNPPPGAVPGVDVTCKVTELRTVVPGEVLFLQRPKKKAPLPAEEG